MSTSSARSSGPLDDARKDPAHIDRDWTITRRLIHGVSVREVRNVVTANGITTELYRPDWGVVEGALQQVIHVALRGGAISAWHQHRHRWDFLFVVGGHLRIVLYDPREQNLSSDTSCFVNMFDRPYDYDDPDEWRLPADTPEIPYRFTS